MFEEELRTQRTGLMSRLPIVLMAAAMVGWQATPAQPLHRHALPFIPSADSVQQGFVRIINQSGGGTVRIYATDDTGERFGPVELDMGANQTRHFNSMDLEHGNSAKELSDGVGDGQGHWWLDLRTNLDIKPLGYIRTSDGFVTSMHDVVREDEDSYHVPFFNPASNQNQRSVLRLTNPSASMVEFTITGRDDTGRSETREVRVSLKAGASHMLDSNRLEADFGYGTGKWHLTIFTAEPLWVMNLLRNCSPDLGSRMTNS